MTLRGGTAVRRLVGLLALAAVMAAALDLAPLVATDVRAATPQLTLTSAATYTVQPEKARVHVTLDATAVSHTQDTITKRFYFSSAYVTILPGTANYTATSGSSRLAVHVSSRTRDYVLLSVDFDRRLYSGQSYGFRLQFDILDPGGAPTRDVRVGGSLVSFPVWAFASGNIPGSSVRVVLPAGFEPEPDNGDFPAPTTTSSGQVVFNSGPLSRPLDFYAYLMADRPGAFAQTLVNEAVAGRQANVLVKAWSDDPGWGKQVADLFRRGLPALASLIGLPYPATRQLTVEEAVSRSLGGYSGLFDPEQGRIQVAYYAEPLVVLHEAAHIWFNSDLASDRWIDEAFASYYAEQAAKQLGIKVSSTALTPDMLRSRIQLNDWGAVGDEDQKVEDYAYAATSKLADLIAQRAGGNGLARTWQAAANHQAAYQPIHSGVAPQKSSLGAPDWRILLDLLEEQTGKDFSDLWREWVVRVSDGPLLDERARVRADYRTTVAAAGPWELPAAIRDALGAWQFADAQHLLADAGRVLVLRDEVERRAKADGLTPPATLRRLFESGGLAAAIAEGQNELTTMAAIEAARAASAGYEETGVTGQLGLIGREPGVQLAAAVTAFSSGDLRGSVTNASLARDQWSGAPGTGQSRIVAGAIGLLLAVAIILLGAWLIRRRRAAPASGLMPAEASAAAGGAEADSTAGPWAMAETSAGPEAPANASAPAASDRPDTESPYATLARNPGKPLVGPGPVRVAGPDPGETVGFDPTAAAGPGPSRAVEPGATDAVGRSPDSLEGESRDGGSEQR